MALIVQKFGGTSVGSVERIEQVAEKVKAFRAAGHDIVVVVSAMSGETNRLIGLAKQIMPQPEPRELDMIVSTGEQVTIGLLSMALLKRGVPAVSFTGNQVRILTDSSHTKARILQIDEERIRDELQAGRVVVVAGFQGVDEKGNITTLGRGGSDTTGVALACGKKGQLLILEMPETRGEGQSGLTLHAYDLAKRKLDKVMDGVQRFDLSAKGEKMLVRTQAGWFISGAGQAPKPGEGRLNLETVQVRVDPRAEWQQMYREAWRIERDYFYDPGHHGLDLKAAERRYAPYVGSLHHRADLNYLFNEMLGELTVGHLYVGGGDMPNPKRVPGGLLGADFALANGRYRIAKVYSGENWNPQLQALYQFIGQAQIKLVRWRGLDLGCGLLRGLG